jgi:hypothetical protein
MRGERGRRNVTGYEGQHGQAVLGGPGALQLELDLAVLRDGEPLLRKWGAHAIAAELLQAQAVVGRDGGVGVD